MSSRSSNNNSMETVVEQLEYKIKAQKRLYSVTKSKYSEGVLMGLIEAYSVVKNIPWADAYNEFFN